MELFEPNQTILLTANGDASGIGRVKVATTIGDITELVHLVFIKNLTFPIIIGLDFMPVFKLDIHKSHSGS